jgi:hypothetical protein
MKTRSHAHPRLERLEDRWCPDISATVKNGILTVAGAAVSPTDTVLVKETAANTFEVDDAGTVVASGLTNVNSVRLNLTGASNVISVDLGGNTLSGNLTANLGKTNNTLTVTDGTISGHVAVLGGRGTDSVTLGDPNTTLTVARDSAVLLGTAAGNTVNVQTGTTFSDDLAVSASAVTLADGANVQDNFVGGGGTAGLTVTVNGAVGGDLAVFGGFGRHTTPAATTLTLGSTGSVGGDLVFFGQGAGDTVDIAGTVTGDAAVALFGSSGSATVEKTATISGQALFAFGNGNDSLTVAGTIDTSGNTGTALSVHAGNGANTVSILGSAVINGDARVRVGSGANLISLHDPATITGTFTLKGGAASTFHGSAQTPQHPTLDLTAFKGTVDNSPNP